jgi:hypothetical protein
MGCTLIVSGGGMSALLREITIMVGNAIHHGGL